MNILEIAKHNVEICSSNDTLEKAAARMWSCDIGCLPVVNDEGHVIGMITDRDICMAAYMQGRLLSDIPVQTAMSRELYFCTRESTVAEVEAIMRSCQVHRLPVLDADRNVIGIVSLNDLAREAEKESTNDFRDITMQEVMHTLAVVSGPRSR